MVTQTCGLVGQTHSKRLFPEVIPGWLERVGPNKSPSGRIWKGVRKGTTGRKYDRKSPEAKKLRRAIRRLKEVRGGAPGKEVAR